MRVIYSHFVTSTATDLVMILAIVISQLGLLVLHIATPTQIELFYSSENGTG